MVADIEHNLIHEDQQKGFPDLGIPPRRLMIYANSDGSMSLSEKVGADLSIIVLDREAVAAIRQHLT